MTGLFHKRLFSLLFCSLLAAGTTITQGKERADSCRTPCAAGLPLTAGKMEFQASISADRNLQFRAAFDGKPVILDSPLGLTVNGREMGRAVRIISRQEKDRSTATYALQSGDGERYFMDVRVFPDGVALRYRLPTTTPRRIDSEQTSFTFPANTRAWYASGPFQYGWIQAYQERKTDQIQGELLAPPATFQLPSGLYAAVTEADLTHFHGAVLLGSEPNRIRYAFVENEGHLKSGIPTGMPEMKYAHSVVRDIAWTAEPGRGTGEIITPWRILMVSPDLNGLFNNGITAQVSTPPDKALFPQGAKTAWIKPGRAVFTWLTEGGAERLSLETHKRYVRGASELGLESVVVDDGWEHWPSRDKDARGRDKWAMLRELVNYGKERHVNIWVWRPSSPRAGNKSDIGVEDPKERAAFMKQCASLGVKGLKIDFFHTENAYTVQLMEDILREAAKNKLMVVFHGVNKPAGDYFTYPNLLAKEAVRGLECVGGENNWAPGPPWPYHNTVLPFTRWLAGGADYTPLNFRSFCPPSLTFAHQFATMYVFHSQMLILAADMDDMLTTPGRRFIENVPAVWDETIVLPESRIGEMAVLARRKGSVWYLAALNGEKPATLETTLSFLPEGAYDMEMLCDSSDDRKKVQIKQTTFRTGDKVSEKLQTGGGLVARISKRP